MGSKIHGLYGLIVGNYGSIVVGANFFADNIKTVITLKWVAQIKFSQSSRILGTKRKTIIYLDTDFANLQLYSNQRMTSDNAPLLQNVVMDFTTFAASNLSSL